jgi:hypothetical protein
MVYSRIMTAKEFFKLSSRRRHLGKSTAYILLEMFMVEHGLYEQGWRGEIGRGELLVDGIEKFPKGCYASAQCVYEEKLIIVTEHHIKLSTPAEIRDTILHEIAHALVGPLGHDNTWAAKATEIGARDFHVLNHWMLHYDVPHIRAFMRS